MTRFRKLIPITINGQNVEVPKGMTLLSAARSAGATVCSACYGNALCATCRVRIISGAENISRMEAKEYEALCARGYADQIGNSLNPEIRLACQSVVKGPISVMAIVKNDN
ncbi:MAG: 2Fe-2S iron-sulfur cluster binding domain-containing protein [Chlorobiales bacterium]|nr:2Fe-2S iron-sulfur cluster binding domain-containing protein [Chlorobiales bacterium]